MRLVLRRGKWSVIAGVDNDTIATGAKHCIVMVNMATRCPEVDPKCTQMRPVKLFIEDRQKVWLSIDDVEWALTYLFTQNQLKGVPLLCDDDAGPGAFLHE